MKIHEYQAKALMADRGIAVPMGRVATTVNEAVAAVRPLIEESGIPVVVVKSQIHAGGRGKGRFKEYPDVGGVNVVTDGIDGGVGAAEEPDARAEADAEVDLHTGSLSRPLIRTSGRSARPRPPSSRGTPR